MPKAAPRILVTESSNELHFGTRAIQQVARRTRRIMEMTISTYTERSSLHRAAASQDGRSRARFNNPKTKNVSRACQTPTAKSGVTKIFRKTTKHKLTLIWSYSYDLRSGNGLAPFGNSRHVPPYFLSSNRHALTL